MVDRLLDLEIAEVTLNLNHLSGIDQISICDIGAIAFEKEWPLVWITVHFRLGRDPP